LNVTVATYGNVLAAVASLHGLATEEMTQDELDYLDPDYEVLIRIRAKKNRDNRGHLLDDPARLVPPPIVLALLPLTFR
jgi:hypothetical protein